MTVSHMLVLAAFILLGAGGLAAIQESLMICVRALIGSRMNSAKACKHPAAITAKRDFAVR